MPAIGHVTYDSSNNTYSGILSMLVNQTHITFQPVSGSRSDKAPAYRIYNDGHAEIGAAWIRQNDQGKDYVTLKLDSPSLPAPIYANLGRAANQDDDDVYAIIWNRPKDKDED